MNLQFNQFTPNLRTLPTLYVSNVESHIKDDEIYRHFSQYGKVVTFKPIKTSENGSTNYLVSYNQTTEGIFFYHLF